MVSPIQPDLLLTATRSLKVDSEVATGHTDKLKSLLSDSTPELRWCEMQNGIAMPPDVKSISCEVDPRSRRFVACIGPSQRGHGPAGTFQVWLDDKLLWQSAHVNRLTKAQQIDIRLPVEQGRRLSLRVANDVKHPVTWSHAGFML